MEFRLPAPIKYYDYYDDVFQLHSIQSNSYNWGEKGEQCFDLWKSRAETLELMKGMNCEQYMLCEPSTYDGNCEKRHLKLTGEVAPVGMYPKKIIVCMEGESEKDCEKRKKKAESGGGEGGGDNSKAMGGLFLLFMGKNVMKLKKQLAAMNKKKGEREGNDGGGEKKKTD